MRRLFLGGSVLVLGVLGVVEFAGCNGDFDICVGDQCPGVADGGGDSADGQVVPTGCDLTKDPKDSAACVDESIGLFVSAGGSDSNAGTKTSPLKSITAALGKTNAQHTRVYVCEGTYGETVKVSSAVGIYGGFHCADWSYDGNQGKVGPAGQGYALDIENVSGAVTVEDLEFDAQKGQSPGDSSIAVFVATSTATLRRVKAIAGNGAAGADAVATSNYDGGVAPTGNSVMVDASAGNVGGAACVNVCVTGGTSTGGAGGNISLAGADGGPDIPPSPNDGAHDGKGDPAAPGCNAHTGANASPAGGATAGSLNGQATALGWLASVGTSGSAGGTAQGGGGGRGGLGPTNGAGGGGGCGGCGGAGGAGGASGGSSFALLSYQSTLTLDTCTLQTGNGGDAKSGGLGQDGQVGGFKGSAVPTTGTGCDGAPGGKGGAGAGGGGGAGGNSIAVGFVGAKPTVVAGSMSEGTAGAPGAGGTGAAGNNGLPGAAGTTGDIQELP